MVFPHGWITVQGEPDADGTLILTGNGHGFGYASTSTLDTWQTRVNGVAMTGDFTFTSRWIRGGDPITVTATLEDVFNIASPEASRPLPAEATMNLEVASEGGTASRRVPSGFQTPGSTTYDVSYSIVNIAAERARLTETVIPIGADGREYTVTQPQESRPTYLQPGASRTGCCASARDFDYQRPIAPRYRLRIGFEYDDGRTGVLEGTGSIRVTRDELR